MGKDIKKVPSKVVAAPGHSVLVDVGNRGLQLRQSEPIDLLEYFSDEEIQASESLKEGLRQGWVVPFTGQKLPKKKESKIKIPKMKVGHGSSSVKIRVVEKKKEGRASDYDYETKIPKEVRKTIEDAQEKRKREELEEKEALIQKQKEELETDQVIKKGKVEVPEITTVRVDGQEVPIKDLKISKRGIKKVKEPKVKVDVQKKEAVKEKGEESEEN